MQARQEGLSEAVRTIAREAQRRLPRRFKALQDRGVQANKACIAEARGRKQAPQPVTSAQSDDSLYPAGT